MTTARVFERFNGWPIKQLLLPHGDRIILTFCWDGTEPKRSPYDANHNIFRLDAAGNVLWQVERDEGMVEEGFGDLRRRADRGETDVDAGFLSGIEPFTCFVLHYPDGHTNIDSSTGSPPDHAIWEPSAIVRTSSWSGWPYELDIERGIARNLATGPIRPW